MNNSNDTWCALPWIHLCIRPDNILKPCCRYLANDPADTIDVNLDKIEANGTDAMNTDHFIQLRQQMLSGEKSPGCIKCYVQEEHSDLTDRVSLRQFLNDKFKHVRKENCDTNFEKVRYIEMSIDNICNLQCKMCTSKYSSKLINRDVFLNNTVHKKLEPNYYKLNNVDLSDLEYVKILGGEPFITPNFSNFIDYLIDRSHPENVSIEIVTNGTEIPKDEIIEKLNRFKFLWINVSIDAYAKSNDYQRYGSSYIKTFENACKYKEIFQKTEISFHSTISLLTANHLADTLDMLTEKHQYHVSVDFVRDPEYLSLLYAPATYLDWVLEKNKKNRTAYRLIENFVKNSKYNKKIWNDFFDKNKKLDSFYNTKLEDYNLELVEFFRLDKYSKGKI